MANASGSTSVSENEMDDDTESKIEWQTVPYSRKRPSSPKIFENKRRQLYINDEAASSSRNRFIELDNKDPDEVNISNTSDPKPPPLYIPNVTNIKEMTQYFSTIISTNQYSYKALRDGQIRVMTKQDRAYRVVIKNLHYSTNTNDMKTFIEQLGHKVRNISNIRSNITKQPLSMFFLDLEPNDNNKEIYNLTNINNAIITIEPPRKSRDLPQCHRCQQYGHTRSYCNKPYKCVKCGENHISADCTKNKVLPAKCANCNDSHPASYRGCIVYQQFKRKLHHKISTFQQAKPQPKFFSESPLQDNNNLQPTPNLTYSEVLKGNTSSNNDSAILQKIETLLAKQMELTNTLLNMMSVLCTKLCQ